MMSLQRMFTRRPGCSVLVAVAVVVAAARGCTSTSPSATGSASSSPRADGSTVVSSPSAPTAPTPAAGTPGGTVPGATPSGGRGTRHCTAGQLGYLAIGSNGAAGTMVVAVRVTNTGPGACWTYGYPGLQIITAGGRPVPTTTLRGKEGMPAALAGAPRRITLAEGSWAWFAVAYHDTPAAPCTSEPVAGARLAVIAPDTTRPKSVELRTWAACGRLGVSAVLPSSSWRPNEWAEP